MVGINDRKMYDVVIVGGGPAGMATALTLKSRGLNSLVVESEMLPNGKTGECIPPTAMPLLKKLGLEKLVLNPQHQKYLGVRSRWGSDTVDEKLFLTSKFQEGFLLDRPFFECQFKTMIVNKGIEYWTGHSLAAIEKGGHAHHLTFKSLQEKKSIHARILVDATGRKASVSRLFGYRKIVKDQLVSIVCEYPLNESISKMIYTESFDQGWIYAAPTNHHTISIMLFTDMDLLTKYKDKKAYFKSVLSGTSFFCTINLDSAKWQQLEVKIRPAHTSYLEQPYGQGWMAVGDAAFSFDPITSFGLTSAIASGYYGGHALADLLLKNDDAGLQVYHRIMYEAFINSYVGLMAHYNMEKRWLDKEFWKRRA